MPKKIPLPVPVVALILLGLVAYLAACGHPDAGEPAALSPRYSEASADEAGEPSESTDPAANLTANRRKLIRTVTLQLRVANTSQAASEVEAMVQGLGGFVSHLQSSSHRTSATSESGSDAKRWFTITLRVPGEHLDGFVRSLRDLAVEIESETLQTKDATAQYVDLGARLKNLTATEDELRALLTEARERRQDVEDILRVYERLTEIRGQIERIQAQRASIDELAALSTVELTLLPERSAVAEVASWRPIQTIREAFTTLLSALRVLSTGAIYLVLVYLPILLIVCVPIWWLGRVLWRRLRTRPRTAAEFPPRSPE